LDQERRCGEERGVFFRLPKAQREKKRKEKEKKRNLPIFLLLVKGGLGHLHQPDGLVDICLSDKGAEPETGLKNGERGRE